MPPPIVPPLNIAGGSTAPDIETSVNGLIDNQVGSAAAGYQSLTLSTVGGDTIPVAVPAHVKGIISGFEPTRTGTLAYSLAIGSYQVAGVTVSKAVTTALSCSAPDATNPRYDLIVGDDAGLISVISGVPDPAPEYPSIASNQAILYVVGIPPATSSFVDSVVVSQQVDTATIPAVQVNANGQVIVGGGVVKPTVVTYTGAGAVDITKSQHLVNSSGGSFAITLPLESGAGEIEGITYSFFDSGSAAANNWTVRNMAGVVLATATTNNQVIRVTFMGTTYKIG